jgi:hypothetical protein
MSDRIVLPVMGCLALAMIALACVWPQGYGARSPGSFGHIPIQQTPQMQAAMHREAERIKAKQQSAQTPAVLAGLRPTQ